MSSTLVFGSLAAFFALGLGVGYLIRQKLKREGRPLPKVFAWWVWW